MFRLTRLVERCRGLGQVLRDPLRKPLSQMVREAADVARRSGAYPEWYFLSFVYRRDAGPYAEYLVRDQYQKLKVLEQDELYALLDDKLRFHERFRDTDCVLPHLLAHNEGNVFRVGETVRHVGDSRGFADLMDELRARSASGSIFVKPVDGMQGRHCRRIDAASTDLGELHAMTVKRRFLFEETLVQHAALDAIFPRSVNTIRAVTCAAPGAPPVVAGALLRLGVGASAVDNASQGGIFVGIDLETGRLRSLARRLFKQGGDVHTTHPDTGFRFEGFEIPHFGAALATAVKAATHVPHPLVGWDLAVTRTGPVLIEGNALPDLATIEMAGGRGLMACSSFRKLYEHVTAAA